MNRSTRMTPAFLSALVLTAGLAFGQAATETKTAKPTEPVLKGPAVKDNSMPGVRGQFGPDAARGKDARGMRGPNPQIFREAVMSLRNDSTPDELRLTATQEETIKLIGEDTRRTMQEFGTKHIEEVRELLKDLPPQERQKAQMFLRARAGVLGGPMGRGPNAEGPEGRPEGREARRPGGPRGEGFRPEGPADGEMMPPPPKGADGMKAEGMSEPKDAAPLTEEQKKEQAAKAEKAKARLKEIMESAPKREDAESKVNAILSDGQKDLVQKRIAEMQKKAEERAAERRPGRGRPGGEGEGRPGAKGGKELSPEQQAQREARRTEMREKLKNMSPEERKAYIEDMRAKRAEKGGKGPRGERKPAPDAERVTPPSP